MGEGREVGHRAPSRGPGKRFAGGAVPFSRRARFVHFPKEFPKSNDAGMQLKERHFAMFCVNYFSIYFHVLYCHFPTPLLFSGPNLKCMYFVLFV